MSSKTTAAANADLDTKFGSGTAGGFYLGALSAVTDRAAGTVTEITGGGYARQAISFAAASSRVKASNADIEFPVATGDHPDIVAWAIYAASSGGSPIRIGPTLSPALVYDTGYQPVIASGDVTVTEAAAA